jgi:hypothetical protein
MFEVSACCVYPQCDLALPTAVGDNDDAEDKSAFSS